jgi:hypothetical protein
MKLLPSDFQITRYGLDVRLVQEDDAEFIYKLRTNQNLNKYLHVVDGGVENQKIWIKEYKKREILGLDYYFIFLINGDRQGVCRLYDIHENDFTSGSWIFKEDAVLGSAVIGDIISREIAYSINPNFINYFDVRKDNTSVIRYALSYKPEIINEDEQNIYFKETREQFEKYKKIYLRMVKK